MQVTWPFAVLQYGSAGVGLRMRGLANGSVILKWSEVTSIESAPGRLVVRGQPPQSFRFSTLSRSGLEAVVREAHDRGILIGGITSSRFGWSLRG